MTERSAHRPVKWTVSMSPTFTDDRVRLQVEGEAEAILDRLRFFGPCPCPRSDCPRRADLLTLYGADEPLPPLP